MNSNQMINCPSCNGTGEWETECCNGSCGCSCRGQVVPMGQCNVCYGSGQVPEDISPEQLKANCKAIAGLCFIGSGPSRGFWAGQGERELVALAEAVVALWPVIAPRVEPKGTPDVIRCWRLAREALEASKAYNEAAKAQWGEFARINKTN